MSGQPAKENDRHSPTGTAHESQLNMFERPESLDALPEIVAYEGYDYSGPHHRTNLNFKILGRDFNDKISSIVVVRGKWRFYRDANYTGDYWDLKVGYYPSLGKVSDVISSFQCIEW